ncbi:MAG: hypothetical protein ORN83_13095 [Chthoniobacteraceae bacterium]|nr:hypothetical protein [Chthoniobacteraceae bacterium]
MAPFILLPVGYNGVKLHEFFGVSERTTRRWQAAGADLSDTNELMHFLRNMERPAASVEERLADPDCHDDLEELLGGAVYADCEKEPVDLAAVRFRHRHDCVISATALKKAGKEVGAAVSELLVQIGEAADLGEEWNELVVRVALVCKTVRAQGTDTWLKPSDKHRPPCCAAIWRSSSSVPAELIMVDFVEGNQIACSQHRLEFYLVT